jgi:hypothetical protein
MFCRLWDLLSNGQQNVLQMCGYYINGVHNIEMVILFKSK